MSRLSAECNRVLSVAAVIGREFRLDVLRRVADLGEDELYALLEEAQGAAAVLRRLRLTRALRVIMIQL